MIYASFADFSEVLHIATSFWRSCSNLWKLFRRLRKWSIYSWERVCVNFLSGQCDPAIKQVRVLGVFILQPEMKPPKSVPARTINTSKRWSSQYSPYGLTTFDPSGTSTPFRLRPEGSDIASKEFKVRCMRLFQSLSSGMYCSWKCRWYIYESVGGIWCRVAHVCLRINPNHRWYMIVLQTFRKCSILLPTFDEPVRNFQKPDDSFENGWFNRERA